MQRQDDPTSGMTNEARAALLLAAERRLGSELHLLSALLVFVAVVLYWVVAFAGAWAIGSRPLLVAVFEGTIYYSDSDERHRLMFRAPLALLWAIGTLVVFFLLYKRAKRRVQRQALATIVRRYVRRGVCIACEYRLDGLGSSADASVVCPECGMCMPGG